MKFGKLVACAVSVTLVLAADLPAIEVVGNKFFYKNNGKQFFIRGVAYQQNAGLRSKETGDVSSFTDPLADPAACKRDVEYLAKARTNVLRVYAVDPTLNHDECMKTFADAGIYIVADLSEPKNSVNRDAPAWNVGLYNRYTSVVDLLGKYSNVLGFFAGNEVTNNSTNTAASAFVKAAVRDTKSYIKSKGLSLPVGYSSNDDADTRVAIANYFSCGPLDERADFFGINMYEWCGDSTYQTSGYKDRTEEFRNLTIPVFFSEYGCNIERPRKFSEIATIFGPEMTDVWSGAIMYMYFEEENKYGLVSASGSSVLTMADYSYYSEKMNGISPTLGLVGAVGASSTATLACPTVAHWQAAQSLPPTPDKDVCDCILQSLSCVLDDSVTLDSYGQLFGAVCGEVDCSAVSADGKNGTYGAVSFCSNKEKLSFVLDAYYKAQGSRSDACHFSGSARLVTASSPTSCQAMVSSISQRAVSSRSSGSSTSRSNGISANGPDVTGVWSAISSIVVFVLGLFLI